MAGGDAENQTWLNDSLASTEETVTRAVCDWRRDWQSGGCEVRVKDDGIAHLSYWVLPRYRGRGLAARALRLVVAFAFAHLGVERAEVYVDVENVASRAVARKAGFVEEGVLRRHGMRGDRRGDVLIASRLKGE